MDSCRATLGQLTDPTSWHLGMVSPGRLAVLGPRVGITHGGGWDFTAMA